MPNPVLCEVADRPSILNEDAVLELSLQHAGMMMCQVRPSVVSVCSRVYRGPIQDTIRGEAESSREKL